MPQYEQYKSGTLRHKYKDARLESKNVYMQNQGVLTTYGQVLEYFATYILQDKYKAEIMGDKGFLKQLSADELLKLTEDYMSEWFYGNPNGGELDYEVLPDDAQARMDEVRDFVQDLRMKKEKEKILQENPPPAPSIRGEQSNQIQPPRPRGVAIVLPSSPLAPAPIKAKVEADPTIVEKNREIIALLAKRAADIAKEGPGKKNHVARFNAMNAIQAYVFREYKDNHAVINLDVVEEALCKQYAAHNDSKKLEEFKTGVNPITSVTGAHTLGRKSEYARMKKEIKKIAEETPKPSGEKKITPRI